MTMFPPPQQQASNAQPIKFVLEFSYLRGITMWSLRWELMSLSSWCFCGLNATDPLLSYSLLAALQGHTRRCSSRRCGTGKILPASRSSSAQRPITITSSSPSANAGRYMQCTCSVHAAAPQHTQCDIYVARCHAVSVQENITIKKTYDSLTSTVVEIDGANRNNSL